MTLREWIEEKKINVAEFARLAGVIHCVARRWVCGEVTPSVRYMKKIEEVTGGKVQPNDFYEVKND